MNWISFQTSILSIHFATINHLHLSHQLNLSFCFISFQLDKWNNSVCDAELIITVISEIETFSLTQSFLNFNQHRLNQSQIIFYCSFICFSLWINSSKNDWKRLRFALKISIWFIKIKWNKNDIVEKNKINWNLNWKDTFYNNSL